MKPLRIPALAAIAGVLLLLFLFPRIDPAARFGTALDRDSAIQRARAIATRYGVNTTGWRASATIVTDEKLRAYVSTFPEDPAARIFTPLAWGVLFTDPGAKRTARVKLFADGRPAEWEMKPAQDPSASADPITPDAVLQDFAGSDTASFHPSDSGGLGDESEWSYSMVAKLDVTRQNGHVVSVALTPSYGHGFTYDSRRPGRIGWGASRFVVFIVFWVAFALAVRASIRGWISWRLPAAIAAAAVAWGVLMMWAGPDYQTMLYTRAAGLPQTDGTTQVTFGERGSDFNAGRQRGANAGSAVATAMTFLGPACLPFLTGFAFAAAGYAGAKGRQRLKWSSLEMLFGGKIFTRQVSLPIAAGALCGLAAAAVPYAAALIFRSSRLLFHQTAVLSAPVALAAMVLPSAAVPAFGYLGFAWPAANRIRKRLLHGGALALLAMVFLFGTAAEFDRLLPSLTVAAIGIAIYFEVYRRFDVLAAVAAMVAAQAAAAPAILLVQPPGNLRDSGVRLMMFLLAGIAAFVNFAIRGRDAEEPEYYVEPEIASNQAPSRSNLKRLEAEFEVARKAQQDALPSAPPAMEGYSFSGSCDPALQVGGDLYDLFPLPDGRVGIAVADVSGKGVPAALYMMVTKGLLTAVSQDSSDLAHILQQINLHLYRACRRRVFVTMAAVAVDAGARRLQYARAGHNPIVWRRAARGETLLRKPPGVGLGMCPNERFNRSLQMEDLDLEPGDAVVLYSDGVTEAVNASMEQFGEGRLMESVARADGRSAEETRSAILRDLGDFTAGTPARDDVTVVVLRVAA